MTEHALDGITREARPQIRVRQNDEIRRVTRERGETDLTGLNGVLGLQTRHLAGGDRLTQHGQDDQDHRHQDQDAKLFAVPVEGVARHPVEHGRNDEGVDSADRQIGQDRQSPFGTLSGEGISLDGRDGTRAAIAILQIGRHHHHDRGQMIEDVGELTDDIIAGGLFLDETQVGQQKDEQPRHQPQYGRGRAFAPGPQQPDRHADQQHRVADRIGQGQRQDVQIVGGRDGAQREVPHQGAHPGRDHAQIEPEEQTLAALLQRTRETQDPGEHQRKKAQIAQIGQ